MMTRFLLLFIFLLSCPAVRPAANGVFKEGEKLTLTLESVSIPMVLNMIAEQYGLNVVLTDDVKGDVSLHLDQVDIKTALEAILFSNGYNYYLKDNVIVVKPQENNTIDELSTLFISLKYIDPVTAKMAVEPILSAKGKAVVLDKISTEATTAGTNKYRPSSLLLTDYPSVVEKAAAIINEIDVSERLISIAVKIIETTVDDNTKLGFSWPTTVTTNLTTGTTTSSTTSTSTTSSNSSSDNIAGKYDLENGRWTWGTLTVNQLTTVLNLLEQSGKSKLISDPRITTLENHEAEIKVQTIIPIQTINRFTEGASTSDIVTFYDEEVGISLVVTPRINVDGSITMDVLPKIEDIIGYSGPPESQKPITISRSVRTKITVGNGETAALGGLLKENTIENKQRVPLLGHIPLLGSLLFTSKSTERTTSDLTILITPTIVTK